MLWALAHCIAFSDLYDYLVLLVLSGADGVIISIIIT